MSETAVEIRPPTDRREHRKALARLIDRAGWSDPQADQRVAVLEAYAAGRELSLDHCLVIVRAGQIEGVCLALDSPGNMSSIVLAPGMTQPPWRDSAVTMLKQLSAAAMQRGIRLLQGMIAPEISDETWIYHAAGFRRLTRLLYLKADRPTPPNRVTEPSRPDTTASCSVPATSLSPIAAATSSAISSAAARPIEWVSYSPATHAQFAQIILQTYENSLDCGLLNGLRDVEDVIASHKATGTFEPANWRLAFVDGQPIGVILMAHIDEQNTYEVVYMGLLLAYRGQGYGSALLAHGITLARAHGVSGVTVTVDEKNVPAQKLYLSFGFRETMSREVWFKHCISSSDIKD